MTVARTHAQMNEERTKERRKEGTSGEKREGRNNMSMIER